MLGPTRTWVLIPRARTALSQSKVGNVAEGVVSAAGLVRTGSIHLHMFATAACAGWQEQTWR